MAMVIDSETKFQRNWLEPKLRAVGHYFDHRFSFMPDVPDVSCSAHGVDYWLELKYGRFMLLHRGYDKLEFETTRGQLSFLEQRAKHGRAICGILAYMEIIGDSGLAQPYIMFMTAAKYLELVWRNQKYCAGAAMLSPYTAHAHSLLTGRDLLSFIASAAQDGARNDG